MPITITEALAEIKTINKRLEKKREFVRNNLSRPNSHRDPHDADGGSRNVLIRERQAIADLEERKVMIRQAINKANDSTLVKIGDETRAITAWLNWRRYVAPERQCFLLNLTNNIHTIRQDAARKAAAITDGSSGAATDIVVNISEKDLAKDVENLEKILGELDGQLSLKNATVTIEVA